MKIGMKRLQINDSFAADSCRQLDFEIFIEVDIYRGNERRRVALPDLFIFAGFFFYEITKNPEKSENAQNYISTVK